MFVREFMHMGHKFRVIFEDGKAPVVKEWKTGKGHWSKHQFWGAPNHPANKREVLAKGQQMLADHEVKMASKPAWPTLHAYGSPESYELINHY